MIMTICNHLLMNMCICSRSFVVWNSVNVQINLGVFIGFILIPSSVVTLVFFFSDCCGPDMVQKRQTPSCHCVYPIKVDLLLLNVSQNPNWSLFLDEFSSGLGLRAPQMQMNNFYWLTLTSLNISLDITPHTGISFSPGAASAINSSLLLHKVSIPRLVGVGDYKLLNVTWYQPPAPSPGNSTASTCTGSVIVEIAFFLEACIFFPIVLCYTCSCKL